MNIKDKFIKFIEENCLLLVFLTVVVFLLVISRFLEQPKRATEYMENIDDKLTSLIAFEEKYVNTNAQLQLKTTIDGYTYFLCFKSIQNCLTDDRKNDRPTNDCMNNYCVIVSESRDSNGSEIIDISTILGIRKSKYVKSMVDDKGVRSNVYYVEDDDGEKVYRIFSDNTAIPTILTDQQKNNSYGERLELCFDKPNVDVEKFITNSNLNIRIIDGKIQFVHKKYNIVYYLGIITGSTCEEKMEDVKDAKIIYKRVGLTTNKDNSLLFTPILREVQAIL